MSTTDQYLEGVLTGANTLLFDGAMGTTLQTQGLTVPGQLADLLCLSNPAAITAIHRAYVEAGAQAVTTNTFNSNRHTLEQTGTEATVADIYAAAVACARAAEPSYVAADIGSTGQMLEPYGGLKHEDAYELYTEQVRACQDAGADFILLETIPAVTEAEIAIRAAKENTRLPVFASMTFEENGFTLMGEDVETATKRMEAAGADVVGINCSHGPETLRAQVAAMIGSATKPVLAQPNAGLPTLVNGQVSYQVSAQDFAAAVKPMLDDGATIIGSCCGSTPEFTRELAKLLA